jgi:uncharacterized protein YwgA
MIVSREIVYANDLCSAFLAAIVKSFEAQHPEAYLGRTAMQKLTYFSKVLGVPVPCSFGIYTYGPYSDKVAFSVESLLADEVISDNSANPGKYSNYRLGRNGEMLLAGFAEELRPHEATIEKTVKVLGTFKPSELELIATLHFISQRQLHTRGSSQQEPVAAEFKAIKKDKFSDSDISRWYGALVQAGLIEVSSGAH